MKTKLILITLILTLTAQAGVDFNQYVQQGKSVSNFVSDGKKSIQDLKDGFKTNFKDFIKDTKKNALDSVTSYLLNQAGGAINKYGADYMKYCYDYKPKPATPFDFSFDICDMINKTDLDPCDVAPNMESMGYYKKENDYLNIKKYCEMMTDGKPQFEFTTRENVSSVELEKILKAKQNKKDIENRKIENTSIGIKNAKNNQVVNDAIYKNDYKTYKILKDVVKASKKEDAKANPDFSQINVEYEEYSDYEDSVESLSVTYATFEEQLNIDKLKSEVLAKIEDEDNMQDKISIVQKAIADYNKILKQYEDIEIDRAISLNIDDENRIVYPTREMISKYPDKDRPKLVYLVEKQKREEAYIISQVKKRMFAMKMKCEVELNKVLVHSEKFDEDAERQAIQDRINNGSGSNNGSGGSTPSFVPGFK